MRVPQDHPLRVERMPLFKAIITTGYKQRERLSPHACNSACSSSSNALGTNPNIGWRRWASSHPIFLRFGMAARGSRATFLCKHQGGAQWTPPAAPKRGWAKLYFDHVRQAHEGADLAFLVGCSGAPIPRDSH
jgi:hypothetical protein